MHNAIAVDNVSKRYTIDHRTQNNSTTLRDEFSNQIRNFFGLSWTQRPSKGATATHEDFWALQDIAFTVAPGERVGIIGRNGAGKSTLLKLLSRITEPTSGKITIRGRVSSLLEVGTGFHPELTGRENIYLNGAILGMRKAEIQRRFDEIVAFAEVEKFLDTPVKRYSSGMYVRLAFSVAAHLEPDVLIVDEVLAVGDIAFQKKCLGKLRESQNDARTVLFVSHNLQAIRDFCNRGIVLHQGRMITNGTTADAISTYIAMNATAPTAADTVADQIAQLPADDVLMIESIALKQNGIETQGQVENGIPLELRIDYSVLKKTDGLRLYFDLLDSEGTLLFRSFHDEQSDSTEMRPGAYASAVEIPANLLGPTHYTICVRAGIYNVRSCLPETGILIPIEVLPTGRYNKAYAGDAFRGKLAPALAWTTEEAK